MARSSASRFGTLRTEIGATVQFSRMVRCGNRLKCWNTMPTSCRTTSSFFMPGVSSWPFTRSVPLAWVSSWLMVRISVDLPEPDGPHNTMRSPEATSRSMSRKAW